MPAFAGEGRYFVMVPEGSIGDPEMPGGSTLHSQDHKGDKIPDL